VNVSSTVISINDSNNNDKTMTETKNLAEEFMEQLSLGDAANKAAE